MDRYRIIVGIESRTQRERYQLTIQGRTIPLYTGKDYAKLYKRSHARERQTPPGIPHYYIEEIAAG